MKCPTLKKDVYKEYHPRAMHPAVTHGYYNYTNRGGTHSNIPGNTEVVFVGLQYLMMSYLKDDWYNNFFWIEKDMAVHDHKRIMSAILGYEVDVSHLEALHDLGFLPLRIKALPEDTMVPYQVPCFTIENTIEGYAWLPGMIEDMLSTEIWPISTSATTSAAFFKRAHRALEESGGPMELLPFMQHDFSCRGMFGHQASAMSGFGHLCGCSAGTDTTTAVVFAEDYYGAKLDSELVGASVDATEHSVTMSWMEEGERPFFEHLMTKVSPTGILSVVSDTWDLWHLVTVILPEIKDLIMGRDGKVVIRPDSGDPVKILCGNTPLVSELNGYTFERHGKSTVRMDDVFYAVDTSKLPSVHYIEVLGTPENKGLVELLWEIFGGAETKKGYKLLDSHIGAIYGDAITLERQDQIYTQLMDKGFCPLVVLGVGSYTYQYVTRDTHGSAVKMTNMTKNGIDIPIFKDPKTGPKKKSAKGLMRVERDATGKLVMFDEQTREQEAGGLLETVFENGVINSYTTLVEIRGRVADHIIGE